MASWTSRRGSCKDSLQGSFSSPRIFAILRWIFLGGFLRIFQGSSMVFRNHFFTPFSGDFKGSLKDFWDLQGFFGDFEQCIGDCEGSLKDSWIIHRLFSNFSPFYGDSKGSLKDFWDFQGFFSDSWQFIGDFEGSLKDSWDLRGFFSHFEPF